MSVTIPFEQALAEMSPEERAAVDVRAAEMLAQIDGLAELRRLADLASGAGG